MNTQNQTKLALGLASLLALGTAGCDDRATNSPTNTTPPRSPAPGNTTPDRTPGTLPPSGTVPSSTDPAMQPGGTSPAPVGTPSQPANTAQDQRITEEIRAMIRQDSSMSATAQGIEVVARSGVVTLRGNVADQAEKDTIEARVKGVSGVTTVINGLEINP